MVCTVCAYTSPMPTILPSDPVAVVPDTLITLPTRTAREYPTIGSHRAPLEIFCLGMMGFASGRVAKLSGHSGRKRSRQENSKILTRRTALAIPAAQSDTLRLERGTGGVE